MVDLQFECFSCKQTSPLEITVENRDHVRRIMPDDKETIVQFMCVHCGSANDIPITDEAAMQLLSRLSSDDPDVQRAVDHAKAGDIGSAVDIARKKFGF